MKPEDWEPCVPVYCPPTENIEVNVITQPPPRKTAALPRRRFFRNLVVQRTRAVPMRVVAEPEQVDISSIRNRPRHAANHAELRTIIAAAEKRKRKAAKRARDLGALTLGTLLTAALIVLAVVATIYLWRRA